MQSGETLQMRGLKLTVPLFAPFILEVKRGS